MLLLVVVVVVVDVEIGEVNGDKILADKILVDKILRHQKQITAPPKSRAKSPTTAASLSSSSKLGKSMGKRD